jgi:hypothetical protein
VLINWDMPVRNTLNVKVLGRDPSGQTKYTDSQDVTLEPHSNEKVYFYVSSKILNLHKRKNHQVVVKNFSFTIWKN